MEILTGCNEAKIISELLNGKTMVFPTETSYGLGCDATNQAAVRKIFEIKGRGDDKPLLVVVPDVKMAKELLVWNDLIEKIATKYWPGPLTVVGEVSGESLASGVVAKDGTVAVRVTSHPLLKSITEKLGRPLVATSANRSGEADIYSGKEAVEVFKDQAAQPDLILDSGVLPKRPPTTIVRVFFDRLTVLRQGETIVSL